MAWVSIGNEEEVPVQTQLSAGLIFKPLDVSEWEGEDFIGNWDGDIFK